MNGKKLRTWRIPVTWSVCGIAEVEGESLESIIENFDELQDEIPLPSDASYIDGSFGLSMNDVDVIRKIYNKDTLKFNPGDEVRIIANESGHQFALGDICVVKDRPSTSDHAVAVDIESGKTCLIMDSDAELVR